MSMSQSKASSIVVPRKLFDQIVAELHALKVDRLWMQSGGHATAESREEFGFFSDFLDKVELLRIDADIAASAPRSSTETLIEAMRVLACEIQSDDGAANAAIAEAAERLAELSKVSS